MEFDKELWLLMLKDATELNINTRVILCQYSSHFDAVGRASKSYKQVARSTGFTVSDVRKGFAEAKEKGWLDTATLSKGRGYRATLPETLL